MLLSHFQHTLQLLALWLIAAAFRDYDLVRNICILNSGLLGLWSQIRNTIWLEIFVHST